MSDGADRNRFKRIVAVRTLQRDLTAMALHSAKQRTHTAQVQLRDAEQKFLEAATRALAHSTGDLERLDVDRIAAREEKAAWLIEMQEAERAQEAALAQVKERHLQLRQSERLDERAEQEAEARRAAAEQRLADERAGRSRRGWP